MQRHAPHAHLRLPRAWAPRLGAQQCPRQQLPCSQPAPRRRDKRRPCRASAESSTDGGRGAGLPLAELRDRLQFAIRTEDYAAAASLRDELQQRQSDARTAVEEVNQRFYRAFESGDMRAMQDVWGRGEHVQVMHPTTRCIAGHESVLESWQLVFGGTRGIKITLEDVRIYAGDTDAFVTCVEVIDAENSRGRTAATNVFEKQGGRWVMVHHQGGPLPPAGQRARPTAV